MIGSSARPAPAGVDLVPVVDPLLDRATLGDLAAVLEESLRDQPWRPPSSRWPRRPRRARRPRPSPWPRARSRKSRGMTSVNRASEVGQSASSSSATSEPVSSKWRCTMPSSTSSALADRAELDELAVDAELLEVEHPGDAAGHAGREVAPGLAEHDDRAAGHVLAAVVADALGDDRGAGVADAEPLADPAADEDLARRGAVGDRVAGDDLLVGLERRRAVGPDRRSGRRRGPCRRSRWRRPRAAA